MLNNLVFKYDDVADVLYASTGIFKNVVYDEIEDGVILRRDPQSGEIVGFTITHYQARINENLLAYIPLFQEIKLPSYC